MDVQLCRSKGKGPTHGWVARTGRRESRWKGAYTDFNREDFSRKGSRRRILKIPGKRGAVRFPFFFVKNCPVLKHVGELRGVTAF